MSIRRYSKFICRNGAKFVCQHGRLCLLSSRVVCSIFPSAAFSSPRRSGHYGSWLCKLLRNFYLILGVSVLDYFFDGGLLGRIERFYFRRVFLSTNEKTANGGGNLQALCTTNTATVLETHCTCWLVKQLGQTQKLGQVTSLLTDAPPKRLKRHGTQPT